MTVVEYAVLWSVAMASLLTSLIEVYRRTLEQGETRDMFVAMQSQIDLGFQERETLRRRVRDLELCEEEQCVRDQQIAAVLVERFNGGETGTAE